VTPRVAIVGAGLAGLAAADRLLGRNVEVALIDKGRHVGGRFCTRTVEVPGQPAAKFDLGPQLLYARRPGDGLRKPHHRARAVFGKLPGGSLLTHRLIGRVAGPEERIGTAPPTGYAISGGMRELAFRMLLERRETIDFHDHTLAERLVRTDDGWRIHTRSLRDGSERALAATALIVTAPVPQALDLLAASRIELPDDLAARLRAVSYAPAIALYGVFVGAGPLPDGGAWFGDGPLEWIADNRAKGVTDVEGAFTAITSAEWAADHWGEPDARIVERLLPTLIAWAGEPRAGVPIGVQRWKWAKPANPLATPCAVVRDLALVLAGDGFAATAPDPADAALLSGESAGGRAAGLITVLARSDNRLTLARPERFTLEVAVSTPDEAVRAEQGGADRLELSAGLEVGGLTPSLGLFREVRKAVDLPVYVLLRPRAGGFCYSAREFGAMLRDARQFMKAGAAGLVFGVLTPDGEIDRRRCAQLVSVAGKRAVFHRAFDFLADPFLALDQLIDLEFERVLTSGGASSAETGTTRLTALVQHAGWQIEVLPAAGVRPENVADLVRETKCEQVHSSARSRTPDVVLGAHPRLAAAMGADVTGMRLSTDAELVAALRSELDRLALSLSSPV
jgi:copper homeostasis protein CutC/predicted NAD/FAD-dependent oxidoreductase